MARGAQPAQPANQTRALTVAENEEQQLRRVVNMVTTKRDQLAMLLGQSVDPERFITVALAAVQGQKGLLECSPLSIFTAIREAAVYGLELGPLGDASLTPYAGEASLSVEYRGYRKLAMRDGTVRVIAADVVYENDAFRIVSGSEQPGIYHEPSLGERGKVLGAYAWARLANGELVYVWMTEAELYKRRDVSRSWRTALKYGRTDSIWHLWPIEMMRKTVIKRLCSEQLPLTPLLREVITRDTEADLAQPSGAPAPGQLQGGDARQRILAAMGVTAPHPEDRDAIAAGLPPTPPALSAGETQAAPIPDGATTGGQEFIPDKDAEDDAAAEAYEAASPPESAQGAPEADVAQCSSPSPYDDVPGPCTKPLGHRLVCSNGKATWDTPKGWAGA